MPDVFIVFLNNDDDDDDDEYSEKKPHLLNKYEFPHRVL